MESQRKRINQLLVVVILLTAFEMPALQLLVHGWLAHVALLLVNLSGIPWLLVRRSRA